MSKPTFRASNTQLGLTENMQILTGQKGDRLDKALTLREAAALGMVNLRRNGSGQIFLSFLLISRPTLNGLGFSSL
ncbi:hypothetical protein A6767_01105 [Aeromonas veronii]|nr:hypothetical protein A6767_01105 [Aeromonas veronii]